MRKRAFWPFSFVEFQCTILRMNRKRLFTLHDYIKQGVPDSDEVARIKASAVEDFKTKVVWDKRTQFLVKILGEQAYVYNPETKTFEIDIEFAKEMAQLGSMDFDGGKFFLGW